MLRKLLPVLLSFGGLAIGLGTGIALRPQTAPAAAPDLGNDAGHGATGKDGSLPDQPREYVKLNNQFVIPLVEGGRVVSMVIMSVSLEVAPGSTELVFAREPKLRDVLLQVMFDHANTGGFRGSFTDTANMVALRRALREAAAAVLGTSVVTDALIIDIVRQDS